MQNCTSIQRRWWTLANTQFSTVSVLVSFGFLFRRTLTGRTSGPILTIYTSYDVFPRKDLLFGGCVDTAPI